MSNFIPDLSFSIRENTEFDELEADDEIEEHSTDLHEAIWDNDVDEVRSILEQAKANKKLKKTLKRTDQELRPPLVYAIIQRNTAITKMLIEAKADVNWCDTSDVRH